MRIRIRRYAPSAENWEAFQQEVQRFPRDQRITSVEADFDGEMGSGEGVTAEAVSILWGYVISPGSQVLLQNGTTLCLNNNHRDALLFRSVGVLVGVTLSLGRVLPAQFPGLILMRLLFPASFDALRGGFITDLSQLGGIVSLIQAYDDTIGNLCFRLLTFAAGEEPGVGALRQLLSDISVFFPRLNMTRLSAVNCAEVICDLISIQLFSQFSAEQVLNFHVHVTMTLFMHCPSRINYFHVLQRV